MQHVSEIVTTSQHLDLLLQHSHETLATFFTNIPNTCKNLKTLPVGHHDCRPKLLLLAAGSEALATSELRAEAVARAPVRFGHGEQRLTPSGGSRSQPQGAPPLVARRW
jgi:hypothetical protein